MEQSTQSLPLTSVSAFQIVPMPVNLNRAAVARQTGAALSSRSSVPRALVPLAMQSGRVDTSRISSESDVQMWVDVDVLADAKPGIYNVSVDLIDVASDESLATANVRLTVYDFSLPEERHLALASQLNWDDLQRLWPSQFEAITPRLLSRDDPRHAAAIKTLDELMALANAHRLNPIASRLQPTVKWPAGSLPQIDWSEYDALVNPWIGSSAYWPLPVPDFLNNFDVASRTAYWRLAAVHFDQNDWLPRASVLLNPTSSGRVQSGEQIMMSADVAQILAAHSRIRVTAPLELDQLQLAKDESSNLIPPASASRLQAVAAPLVSDAPTRSWPSETPRPSLWLRTDQPDVTAHVGAASDEQDVRSWAYLAHLRSAQMIMWPPALPSHPATEIAEESEFVWFYPGQWFGIDKPVPTLQLKWLRRAEQDFEYLWLARQRGETINPLILSRLICKPVELAPGQPADPAYALLTGTSNANTWTELQKIIAESILTRSGSNKLDAQKKNELSINTLRWRQSQEQPLLIPRGINWLWDTLSDRSGSSLDVRVNLDLYNPAADTPDPNTLQWTVMPPGWVVRPQVQPAPPLPQFKVRRISVEGRFDLEKLQAGSRRPIELTFTNGYTKRRSTIRLSLPVAMSLRRESRLMIDGSLEDWDPDDALADGPLVQMLSVPAIQQQALRYATTPSQVYSNWSDENFYVGFKLAGAQQTEVKSMRNFVNYDLRRAWGEDLCQILVQPLYIDNSVGPVLHVVCKPGGQWIERKMDPRINADPWLPVEGAAVRYASTLDGPVWRGEVAIPWKIIDDPRRGHATLLRFNFIQHKNATGESASWCGPVDFARDEQMMGLIHLREPNTPGMK